MSLKQFITVGQKIEITVWPDDAEEGITFVSYIKDVLDARFLVDPAPAMLTKVHQTLRPETLVAVQFLTENRDHILCYPTVNTIQSQGLVGYWLLIPDTYQYEMQNRRNHVRVWMVLPVNLEYRGKDGKQLTSAAYTQNVSGGGMRFTSDYQFLAGETVRAKFHLDEKASPLDLVMKIIFCSENSESTKVSDRYVCAASFQNISPHQEGLIMQECFRRELRMKRSS